MNVTVFYYTLLISVMIFCKNSLVKSLTSVLTYCLQLKICSFFVTSITKSRPFQTKDDERVPIGDPTLT